MQMEPEYFVVDGANRYGPATLLVLNQWAMEGRISPTTQVQEVSTGRLLSASQVPGIALPAPPTSMGPGQTQTMPGQNPGYSQPGAVQGGPQFGGMGQEQYRNPPQQSAPYYRFNAVPGDPKLDGRLTLALVLSILGLLCSCLPGIPALVLAIMGKTSYSRGDYMDAERKCRASIIWAIVSFVVGVGFCGLNLMFNGFGGYQ